MLLDMMNTINGIRGRPVKILMGDDALEQLKNEWMDIIHPMPYEKTHSKNRKKLSMVYFFDGIPIEAIGPGRNVHYIYDCFLDNANSYFINKQIRKEKIPESKIDFECSKEEITVIPCGTQVHFLRSNYAGVIIGICIRDGVTYEVAYFETGNYTTKWVNAFEFSIDENQESKKTKEIKIGY